MILDATIPAPIDLSDLIPEFPEGQTENGCWLEKNATKKQRKKARNKPGGFGCSQVNLSSTNAMIYSLLRWPGSNIYGGYLGLYALFGRTPFEKDLALAAKLERYTSPQGRVLLSELDPSLAKNIDVIVTRALESLARKGDVSDIVRRIIPEYPPKARASYRAPHYSDAKRARLDAAELRWAPYWDAAMTPEDRCMASALMSSDFSSGSFPELTCRNAYMTISDALSDREFDVSDPLIAWAMERELQFNRNDVSCICVPTAFLGRTHARPPRPIMFTATPLSIAKSNSDEHLIRPC